MKYYKIINENTCIGIVNSNNFIAYQPGNHSFTLANEKTGDLVEYKNKFYRGLWMKPLTPGIELRYTIIDIIEITKEEYDIFEEAIKKNEVIEIESEQESAQIKPYIEPPESGIDFIRSSKLNEMSYACRTTIEGGFDLELRGITKHFSLDTQDQLNLITLSAMAQTQTLIPYHADGEECVFYTNEEINEIVETANAFKIYHTTYYNALKTYINALETIEEISAIIYGVEIPDEYKSDVLKVLEQ